MCHAMLTSRYYFVILFVICVFVFYRSTRVEKLSRIIVGKPSALAAVTDHRAVSADADFDQVLNESISDFISRTKISKEDWAFVHLLKANSRGRPQLLNVYFFYDATARIAALEMSRWLHAQQKQLPLFANRLSPHSATADNPKFCVMILSARRRDATTSALKQTVVSLLTRMQMFAERSDFYIHVFNVDSEPEKHTEIIEITDLVPVSTLKNTKYSHEVTGRKDQETLDYFDSLRATHSIGCPYATILEDDTLADVNWTKRLRDVAAAVEGKSWGLVRLYTEDKEKLQGLSTKLPPWGSVAMMYNREYLLPLAHGLEQGLLLNVRKGKLEWPKDMDIPVVLGKLEAPQFTFYPPIFQHIGVFSSVQNTTVEESYAQAVIHTAHLFESHRVPLFFDPDRWADL